MAFVKETDDVQFSDLKGILSQSRAIDPALYQTIQTLLERLDQFKTGHDSTINNFNNSVNTILQNIIVTPNITATYHTLADETGQLPASVQLLAGSGIIFDDSVLHKRTIKAIAVSSGADLDYLGDYVTPNTYNDGDIVVGTDGIAYMCIKDGTTTPPEAWPGANSGSGVGSHHNQHETGGTDAITSINGTIITSGIIPDARLSINILKFTGGYPGGTVNFLRADGTFAIPPTGVAGAHHTQHEIGGTDVIQGVAWLNQSNTFTAQLQEIKAIAPILALKDLNQPAGSQPYIIQNSAGLLLIRAYNDAYSVVQSTPLYLDRGGNAFVGNELFSVNAMRIGSTAASPNPSLYLTDATQTTNSRVWRIMNQSAQLNFYKQDDGESGFSRVLSLDRLGNAMVAGRLQIGPASGAISASVPAWRNTGADMEAVLGDNSNWAVVRAHHFVSIGGGNSLADLTCGSTNFTNGLNVTAGAAAINSSLQTSNYIYPGNVAAGGAGAYQNYWFLASHSSFGLYTNTGLYVAGDLTVAGTINGGGSGVGATAWIDVPYDQFNYSTNDITNTGSITPIAASPNVFRYCIIGKTMILQCSLRVQINNIFTREVRFKIPTGFTLKPYDPSTIGTGTDNQAGVCAHWGSIPNATSALGVALINIAGRYVTVQRADGVLGAFFQNGDVLVMNFTVEIPLL